MKKLLALILAGTMALSMAGCMSSNDLDELDAALDVAIEELDEAAEELEEATSEGVLMILDTEYAVEEYAICIAKDNEDLLEAVDAALVEIIENGTADAIVNKYISGEDHDLVFQADADGKDELHMATNAAFPPYEYYENDTIVGIDAEMAAAIADALDMKLVIDDMEFDAIITAVQSGKSDMGMAGMTVTEDRLQSINFTTSYATGIQSIIVPVGSEITTVDDLYADGAAYLVGVQSGTTGDIYAEDDFGSDLVSKYQKGADAVQALVTGKVDCVIIDNEPAKAFVAATNG
ncbi:MAG: transporter substrate-binding domain-containing protein [Eubacteriales bacterium]